MAHLLGRTKSVSKPNFVGQSSETKKLLSDKNFEIWSRFSQNFWTLVHIFRHSWKTLEKYYKTHKYCGPKYKMKKLWWVKFWHWFQFSRNWWTLLAHISETVWSFVVKFCTLTCQTQMCLQIKFCGPKFRNKKVLKWPNFELWSRFAQNLWTLVHIFRHCWKALAKHYKTPKNYGEIRQDMAKLILCKQNLYTCVNKQ